MIDMQSVKDPYVDKPVPSLDEIAARRINNVGRTAGGRFTYAGILAFSTEDDFPPDSKYWRQYAMKACNKLADIIGDDAYFQFGDICWPEKTIEDLTWRTICEMAEAAILLAKDGERDVQKLASAAHDKLENLIGEKNNV